MNGQEEFSDRSSVVAEVDRLLAALDRNDISQPEADRLQFLVCHDEQARERYIRSVNLKASLEWDAVSAALAQNSLPADVTQNPHAEPAVEHQDQQAIANTPTIPLAPLSGTTSTGLANAPAPSATSSIVHWLGRPSSFLMLAFVLTASVAAIVASRRFAPHSPEVEKPLAQERRTEQTIAPLAPSVEASPSVAAPPSVARLTGVNDAVWREGSVSPRKDCLLQVGQRLDLAGGFAEVTFECGAVVMLNAPASIVIKAPNGGKIEFGKIAARVPGPSAKFWIQTPNNRILDLGTEFGVSVDAAGVEQICVFDGAIEVDSGQQVKGRTKTLLRTGEVVLYGPQGERISGSEIDIDLEDSFVRTMPSNYESNYVQEILSAQPVGYWSFNSVIASALVPDVSGKGRFGYMKGNAAIAQGGPVLAIGQAMALDGRGAHVSIPAAASLSLAGDFSMEVLFRTASAGPLISKVSNDGTWCAGAKMLFVRGGAVQFTPDTNLKTKSLRAIEYVNDGQWHHVVLTNKARGKGKHDVTILYLDGVERARRDNWIINHENDQTMPIKIGVACKKYPLPPNTAETAYLPSRSYFPGYLDEIAIYNRVLLPSEAKAHYRAFINTGMARRQMAPDSMFGSLKDSFLSAGDTVIESDWVEDEEARLEEGAHSAMTLLRLSIIATLVLSAASSAMPAIRGPYDVDEHTLHLYHFDAEARFAKKRMTPDAVGLDPALGLAFQNGAKRTRGFHAAFGSAIDTSATSVARLVTFKPMPQSTFWNQQTGAFTYEAIVQMDFDPRKFLEDRPCRMQILSVDNDESGPKRGFLLSLRPIGVHGATALSLEFVKIGSGEYGPRVQTIVAVLPGSGLHSPIPEAWFHVAVSYDGNEGKRDNLKIYWTRVAPEVTAANLVHLASLDRDPPPDAMLSLSVGNRVRSSHSNRNPNENWQGKIDEVRISSVAHRPQEFLFSETGVATALKGAEK